MSARNLGKQKACKFPPVDLLEIEKPPLEIDGNKINKKKHLIEKTFREFGVEGAVKNHYPGPVITTYEFFPKPGTKTAKVPDLDEALSHTLGIESVRIQRVPGKSSFGIELPNTVREPIRLGDILRSRIFRNSRSKLTFALGKNPRGEVSVADLRTMPNLLIAGDTGAGKSILLHTLIASLLFKASPKEVKLILIDPKRFEFSHYDGLPHLFAPVIYNPKKALAVLVEAVKIMEERHAFLSQHKARNIQHYNNQIAPKSKGKNGKPLPYIVIIADEFADLSLRSERDIDYAVPRLGYLAKGVGIHLVFATQRLSIDAISGTVKNNFPSRIAFRVRSKIDSRLILDTNGAEKLLGLGDMLFIPPDSPRPIRLHGAYVSIPEIDRIVNYAKNQGAASYDERIAGILKSKGKNDDYESEKDRLYDAAVRLVLAEGKASVLLLQRKLNIGYLRASRIIDMMEMECIISPFEGPKPREILADASERLKKTSRL